jgi:hypothetical protein
MLGTLRVLLPVALGSSGERYRYVEMSRRFPIPVCQSFHCFRFLPPLLTRLLPPPTIPAFIATNMLFENPGGIAFWHMALTLAGRDGRR